MLLPPRNALLLVVGACAPAETPTFGPGPADTEVEVDTEIDDGTTWQLGPEVVCADPGARLARAFRPHEPGGAWADQAFDPDSPALFTGGGLAAGDLTGDGRLDLLVTSHTDAFRYWVQTDGLGFEDARDRLPPMPAATAGVTVVDLDDDGDLDAFVAVYEAPDVVLLNDGHGTFTEAAADLGLQGPVARQSISSSWGDLDRDGDLDGFVAGYGRLKDDEGNLGPGDPSSIWIRGDDGTFRDVVPDRPPTDVLRNAHTFGAAFVDADLDGWQDLYVVDDFGWTYPSQLLHNDAGTLTPAVVGAESDRENMGLGIGDTNGDERPDFLVAAWDDVKLYESDAAGGWTDVARARELGLATEAGQNVAWGSELVDLDDDADLDAVVVMGHLPITSPHVNPLEQPDGVWLFGVYGTYDDLAPGLGLDDTGRGRGVLAVDLDRNGFLDLVRTDLTGPTTIDLGACDDHAWLRVDLRQPAPNVFAIGARIRVGLPDRVLVREVRAGGTGYASGGPPEVHFGLGRVDEVDFVEVIWPDGTVTRREHVATRRGLTVSR